MDAPPVPSSRPGSLLTRCPAALAVLIFAALIGTFALPFISVDPTLYGRTETDSDIMTGWELASPRTPTGYFGESLPDDAPRWIIKHASLLAKAAASFAVLSLFMSVIVALRQPPALLSALALGSAALIETLALGGMRALGVNVNPIGGWPTVSYYIGYWSAITCAFVGLLIAVYIVLAAYGLGESAVHHQEASTKPPA